MVSWCLCLCFCCLAVSATPLALPTSREIEVDVDGGLDQDIFNINEELGLNLIEGDIRHDTPTDRSAIANDKFRWPKTVPYYLEDSLDVNAKGVILKAFEQYRLKSCIDFKPWSGEANYISVFKGSGCWSYVGNQHVGKQQLSIRERCERIATIEHEFLHALGFWHEQSRPDRDDYVKIIWDRIENGQEHNFDKYDDKLSITQNIPYDYTSVMHYGSRAFTKGSEPTIVTKIAEFSNVIGQHIELSDYDLQKVNRLYNCTTSLSFLDSCGFEGENICGMIQGPEDTADWQRVSQAPGGPYTDFTNMGKCRGSGYFMYFNTSTGTVGQKAFLESRIFYPMRGFQCLQFYSFNSGSERDELNIWVRVYNQANPNGTLTKIGRVQGVGLNHWQIHHVSLRVSGKFRVVFEGVKQVASSDGGISIDDINLSETHCPTHVWPIRNFTNILNSSPSGFPGVIHSPRYYSREGYAFQISLYVNGTNERPFYLGVFLHLVNGVHDDRLKWPCPWMQGTMLLMDQHPDIRRRMSHQRSVTTDPNRTQIIGNQISFFWDRPDKVGYLVREPDGTQYYRGPGLGISTFLSHERLKSREFVKGDDAYFLLTMEDASHLIATQPTPSVPSHPATNMPTPTSNPIATLTSKLATDKPATDKPATDKPVTDILESCTDFQCENEGVCTVLKGEPECRCQTGDSWWYSGKYCENLGKQQDTVLIAVTSSVVIFVAMLLITLLTAYCLR
ncbi:meprin A subunit beta-like [Pristis pectinata]|uniref:meprin A subunit beta-like n=1 Tax=Pristis pectinata TaxID=685728 RepID=UPI00223D6FBA|nr:meprin A subunit beta-like [Pristis pectinata]